MAIAIAAKQIMVDGMQVTVGTGQEQISLVQNAHNLLASEAYDSTVLRMVRTCLYADASNGRMRGASVWHPPANAGRLTTIPKRGEQ